MWRLVLDSIRRQKGPLGLATIVLAPLWLSAGAAPTWPANIAFASSVAVACFMGPLMGLVTFTQRAIRQLPVSSRDVWRAIWVRSAVVSPLATTTAKLPALLFAVPGGHAIGAQSMALSCLYDLAYAGASTAWLILIAQRSPRSGPGRLWSIARDIASLMLLLAAPVWPLVLRQQLATRWSDLSGPNVVTLLALLGVAAGTFFYRPGAATASMARVATPRRGSAASFVGTTKANGATGLRRLVVNELAWTGIIGAMILSTFGAVAYFVGLVSSDRGHGFVSFLRAAWLLPFDARTPTAIPDFTDLLIWLALFFLTQTARFGELLRHLRTLPLGVTQLNAILVAWPLLIWSLIWTVLLAIHVGVLRAPVDTAQPALFLSLVGMSALAIAVELRRGSGTVNWVTWVIAGFAFGSRFFSDLLLQITPASLGLLGIAGMLAAAALNVRTLARSATYAPKRSSNSLGQVKA